MIADNYTPVKTLGNGVTTEFSFGFALIAEANIRVYLEDVETGVQTLQTLGTDYTVEFDDDTPGGTVTFADAPSDDYYVVIGRDIPKSQAVPLTTSAGFQAKVVEGMVDKAVGGVQDIKEEVKRTLKTKIGGTTDLTVAEPDPGKGLKWNVAGDGIENSEEDLDDIVDAAQAAQVAAEAAQTAAEAAKTAAETAETNAETAETNAETAQAASETARDQAVTAKNDAVTAKNAAEAAQTAAETAETNAETAETNAEAAQTAAEAAKTAAETAETNAETAETNAETAETNAESAQTAAEAARDLAQNYATALKATSTSEITIGTGEKTFAIQSGKQFAAGQFIVIVDSADSDNYMHGQVVSYTDTTLVVDVQDVGGSGTISSWNIYVSGTQGTEGPSGTDEKVKNVSGDASAGYLAEKLAALYPSLYQRDQNWALKTPWTTAANRYTILTPNKLAVDINGTVYFLTSQSEIDLSSSANWDSASPDYTVAANRAGKDFYIYACVPVSGSAPKIVLSANSSVPAGYNSSNSRKIGGFHGLCVAVGTISGHTLTDFAVGDVLPASTWDLLHKSVSNPEGMVYSEGINKWVDIYLASGTGSSTASVYGGTISDTRNWSDFADDGGAVKKRMLDDDEFQLIAAGSNEETNITGSSDPGTTGGHVDTASRRMISNIGVEDACGVMQQWLRTQTYYPHGSTAYWGNLPGGKGSVYTTFSADPGAPEVDNSDLGGDVKLCAGGSWSVAAGAGSRYRAANSSRWFVYASIGCRFCAEPV